ncbi:hypothetical protein L3081_19835 [Colwellia sp. MSW7]|uniref:Uncharacterized protein n=1 Tax=Colwellia maritima TaxID=2912588 RepID=A0ABS9X4P2_9GAMM|nr:hypothetical protein [Colwellia maritima]MCI2285215.1 hypothetical protein [Colwellia maritima]
MSGRLIMQENKVVKLTKSSQCASGYYQDEKLGIYVGVGSDITMIEAVVSHSFNAFIYLIKGDAKFENQQIGTIETVKADDSFVIPQGYDWQKYLQGNLQKFLVIYQQNADILPDVSTKKHIIFIDEQHKMPWQKTSDGFHKKVQYESHNKKFTGVWQGQNFETGVIRFPYNEFILLKQGSLVCVDDQGKTHTINVW